MGILELVVFKLKDGATREQLLATVDGVNEWASTQPGFVSRELTYAAEEDRWIDIVRRGSLADAESAAAAATSSPSCAPMFGLIDEESMLFLRAESAETLAR